MTQAYPLNWPTGWPRAVPGGRKLANFSRKVDTGRGYSDTVEVTVAVARERLQRELDLLRAEYVTLSTNLELRLDGLPRSGAPAPVDPGVALYFRIDGKDTVLACDRWTRVADNIVAIAKHIEALRGMDRWGVGTAAQAFAGYQALPAPEASNWRTVLGYPASARVTIEEINLAYRSKAKHARSEDELYDLNAARDAARLAVNG